MKARSARSIVLAHAIETSASHEALPTPARCQAITQESLHALGKNGTGKGGASGKAGFEVRVRLQQHSQGLGPQGNQRG